MTSSAQLLSLRHIPNSRESIYSTSTLIYFYLRSVPPSLNVLTCYFQIKPISPKLSYQSTSRAKERRHSRSGSQPSCPSNSPSSTRCPTKSRIALSRHGTGIQRLPQFRPHIRLQELQDAPGNPRCHCQPGKIPRSLQFPTLSSITFAERVDYTSMLRFEPARQHDTLPFSPRGRFLQDPPPSPLRQSRLTPIA